MLFQHTRRCQCVSTIHPVSTIRPNIQLIAVEQRSRKSCLDVLHGLRLELVLGLELFCRLIARKPLALFHCSTIVSILGQKVTYEFLPPTDPQMSATRSRRLANQYRKHLRSSLALGHTRLNSLDLSRPETSRSPLVLRPSNARRAYSRLEVIDGRGDAGSALSRGRSCAG